MGVKLIAVRISVRLLLLTMSALTAADISVTDSMGRDVRLQQPAQRVITLAPHIIENMFAAGAGDLVVGTVSYSNYPAEAKAIPQVGSFSNFSVESIVALNPDLVIGWSSGHKAFSAVIRQLEALQIPVYVDEPRQLGDISRSLRNYGVLTNREPSSHEAAYHFDQQLAALRTRYAGASPVSVFYQVWNRPLQTLNGKHIVSDLIRLCGGRNIFSDAVVLAPRISTEAVLARNPDVIIASGMAESRPEWLDDWKVWPSLRAVQKERLFFIPPDWLQRHTPRLLNGAQMMCAQLAEVRQKEQQRSAIDGRAEPQ